MMIAFDIPTGGIEVDTVETVDYERYDGRVGRAEIIDKDFADDVAPGLDYTLAVIIPTGEFVVIFYSPFEEQWVESVMSASLLDGEF